MTTHVFLAQDADGRRCRITLDRGDDAASPHRDAHRAPVYLLEDGSHVRRLDNDTFQILATGAYVTRVVE